MTAGTSDNGRSAPAQPIFDAGSGSLQEAIDHASLHNRGRFLALILSSIAEHMRQHLGIKDAARCRDEGAEILLPVESISEADALGGKMLSGNTRTSIGGDLDPLPVFVRGPGAV